MPRPAEIPKTGGRKEGTPNKATAAREAEIRAAGVTPLEFMLGVMRDDNKAVELRLEAAAKAAPYVHPRLASVAVGNKGGEPFQISLRIANARSRSGMNGRADCLMKFLMRSAGRKRGRYMLTTDRLREILTAGNRSGGGHLRRCIAGAPDIAG